MSSQAAVAHVRAASRSASAGGGKPAGVALGALLARCDDAARLVAGDPALRVGGVSCDSRRTSVGDLFVAVPGEKADGGAFVTEALRRGAVAVVVTPDRLGELPLRPGAAVIACDTPRSFLADAAAELAGRPSDRMCVVAVTGTSGKTTTTYLLEAILVAAGRSPGIIGTIEYRYGSRHAPATLTTPDAVELQGLLAHMAESGVGEVALEASSHALALDRLRATSIDVAVFTNFSRDHLDYHHDMDSYFAAKARLFRELLPASGKASAAVLNAEDPRVMSLAGEVDRPVVSFGAGGDVRCEGAHMDLGGTRGELVLGSERVAFETPLVGAPHLANVLAAAATAWRLGISTDAIVAGIATCATVPGRIEVISAGQPFPVVVDYAHKPDALESVLGALRSFARGRLVVVFGCGGDRDAGKRPVMGEIAGQLADVSILTSDNPRSEDPMAILAAIEEGVRRSGRTRVAQAALGQLGREAVYAVVPERRAAIREAIGLAREGDVVVIAGKGHEDYQLVGTRKQHLDDREEARASLAARGFGDRV
jgi:UDP-N-acetylmuramoyl-L-alanyl-D-glutamate--2,6-diaminopimelate ligase